MKIEIDSENFFTWLRNSKDFFRLSKSLRRSWDECIFNISWWSDGEGREGHHISFLNIGIEIFFD